MKHFFFLSQVAAAAVLFCASADRVQAQSALDGFDPNANGNIQTVVVQPDGKILIGGSFTTLSPNGGPTVTRNGIARLNADGTLDTAFDPNASSIVYAIVLQPDGKILVGGIFTSVGGQTRNRIARLDPATGQADSFNPNANAGVHSIAVQADGKILVGGDFGGPNSIGGQARNYLARLNATTGLPDSFDANSAGNVRSIVLQADGKILVGGYFLGIGGQTRRRIARLDPATGLADSFDPNANDLVTAIAVQADGRILAGGNFTSIGSQTRNHIARLDATSGLADGFDPNANDNVVSIAVQADGKILVGGNFHGPNGIGGQTRDSLARLDASTGLADSFAPNPNSGVNSIAVETNGKILVGGVFFNMGGQTRNGVARLESDGRLDQTLNLGSSGSYLDAIAVQPDGKIIIGGLFSTVSGVARNNIARLNTDGTLDMNFDPNANNEVRSIAVQADGRILVGGDFTSIGGQNRSLIARLDATTGLADSFDAKAGGFSVYAIALQADGKILAGGNFTSIGGQTRNSIARLDSATALADSFDPNSTNYVYAIAVQADGKILVGGAFFGANSIGGQSRNCIARLDATTGLPDSFDPSANGFIVYAIAVQADGKILVGGSFTAIGGQTRNRIARLDASTGLSDSFNPNAKDTVYSIAIQADGKILAGGKFFGTNSIGGQLRNRIARLNSVTGSADSFDPNANSFVFAIAVQADGKIFVGGNFLNIGGQPQRRFARLTNDTAALQDLAVTQTSIAWTRSGSSPDFARVTFEYSTDNINYVALGEGIASGSDWTLNGLNLSTGQNIYVRGRGYYRTGEDSGSDSTQELVRNAFLAGPPPTPSPTPTATATATASPTPTATATATPTATATATPTATPTPTATASPTATPTATPGTVGNVSTRLPVGTGDNALIEGFIVQGAAGSTKKILVRAIGPSLLPFGITDALANPTLEIHDSSGATIATNNDWKVTQIGGLIAGDQSAEISSSGLAPGNDLESAIIANLMPGSYTAVVRGLGDATGTGVVDAYDLSAGSPAKLANIATRGLIQAGDKLMIAGFIVQNAPVRAVICAIGPSLLAFGISNALPDTTLQLRDQNGAIVLENDDWQTDQKQELESTGLQPSHDLEAALVTTIQPGPYTAQVRGKNNSSGIGVVQVYFLQ